MSTTMEQLCFVAPGQLEWQEAEAPRIEGRLEAIVRPIAVASCDLDAAIVHGTASIPGPFPIGHEFAAEVLEIGDGVYGVEPGARVVAPFQISCGECVYCLQGQTAHCSESNRGRGAAMYGIGRSGGDHGGALSDLLRIPFADAMLVPVSEAIPLERIASAADNVADGWRTVAPALAARPGSRVLVLNGGEAGSIGLYATSAAIALGSAKVDYFDRSSYRVKIARELGAKGSVIDEWPDDLGAYPITVDCTQVASGLGCALRSTERTGFCTSSSIFYQKDTPVPIRDVYFRGIKLSTELVNSRAVLPKMLDLIASGRFDPTRIPTKTVSWKTADEALLEYKTKLVILRDGQ